MAAWRDAANAVHLPYDSELGIHQQSSGFTRLQEWDFEHTPAEHYPLLLHFPYFDLYRKQVVKQADLVLAMHWRGDAFSADQKLRNFAYYEERTVRDSSLSACTQAVLAAEVGYLDLAYDYLGEAALMDLHDLEHNTRDGLHMAALAGAWISIVCGLGGMRDHGGVLSFAPRLPGKLHRLKFALTWHREVLGVEIDAQQVRYTMERDGGQAIDLLHYGERVRVSPDRPVTMKIPPLERASTPIQQPFGRQPGRRH